MQSGEEEIYKTFSWKENFKAIDEKIIEKIKTGMEEEMEMRNKQKYEV